MSAQRLRLWIMGLLCMAAACPVVWAQDAELAKKINEAIDKGVAYVKAYSDDGAPRGAKRPASWALRGWALLEAGVPAGAPAVKKVADYVRQEVPEMDKVYDLSLSLIFLDKLADRGDEPLIESMAVRLMAGQRNKWGWEYAVDKPNMAERTRLARLIQATEEARQKGFVIKAKKRTDQEIAQDVTRQLRTIDIVAMDAPGDNSNTQFAMIAVWIARPARGAGGKKHGDDREAVSGFTAQIGGLGLSISDHRSAGRRQSLHLPGHDLRGPTGIGAGTRSAGQTQGPIEGPAGPARPGRRGQGARRAATGERA